MNIQSFNKKVKAKLAWFGAFSAPLLLSGVAAGVLTSCSDFFDQESEHVIFTDKDHLNSATDSIYSVTGILSKLQVLADRTILLGEVRGDLVDVTDVASSDLRDIALFNVGDDNQYNQPRDYYAVINNCNYFIANVDTGLRNNRNELIFMKEYAAVKAIRAWTYLQLVLNYGSVTFVTEPILTKIESEADYPRYDLQAVCEYFINDLLPLAERYGREYPGYGTIRNTDSRFFWFPINIVLGDLYLWSASASGNKESFKQAALRYYKYISERNGENSIYPIGTGYIMWSPRSSNWTSITMSNISLSNENYSSESELITMIPGDSIRAEGSYSELRNLFNSTEDNDYKMSLIPSKNIEEISASQKYCHVTSANGTFIYAPQEMDWAHTSGDLRLYYSWSEGYTRDKVTGERIETQTISKYATRNIHIYRRQQVFMRMAEALNHAGYPRAAFQILSQGMNNEVLQEYVYPYCSPSDSAWISQIDFPTSRYGIFTAEDLMGRGANNHNTMGIHSRGSGWTPFNEYYQLPEDTLLTESQLMPIQQEFVDSLLLNEDALEFAFEGMRYYDIMRFALRSSNPGQFLANQIWNRRGKQNRDAIRSELKKDLTQQQNWYLNWKDKIGF